MHSETTKRSNPSSDDHQNKSFERELRDMVDALTHRVTDFHKAEGGAGAGAGGLHRRRRSDDHEQDDDQHHRVRIITLAGTNTGATMRSELEEIRSKKKSVVYPMNSQDGDDEEEEEEGEEGLGTYVNSNFQAVNNSLMLGSSYTTNDPGVHLDISDTFQHRLPHHATRPDKHAKKGKKKEKDHHSEHHSD
ncbi:hypothetical protein Tsubulata_035276 [Turnera subulata]|uniref:Uncharacterized protein n=1 Tax=Turnera subulata TaxID=218843 RepID=A0A9Q0GFQ5_9ROSI|nr:hypothetical protein Tsubulata_035276 [Turnera subulata]